MVFEEVDFKSLNKPVLVASLLAFAIAVFPPILSEFVFGGFNLVLFVWIMIPVAFHEIGHVVFRFLVTPFFQLVPPLYFIGEPIHYLGGFLFNAIAGLGLLWFLRHLIFSLTGLAVPYGDY